MAKSLEEFLAGSENEEEGAGAVGGVGAAQDFIRHSHEALRQALQKPLSDARRKCNVLLRQAIKAFEREDLAKAGKLALEASSADPSCGQAYHLLALTLERLGALSKAVAMYQKAFELDPKDSDLYLNLGLAAWKLKLFDGAERCFKLYIDMKPDNPSGYNNLAAVLRDKGRFEDAIELLQAAICKMPEAAILWNTVGTVIGERGDFEQAQTFYQEAIRLNPKFGRAYHNVGYALTHTGHLNEAISYFERAMPFLEVEHDRFEAEHALSFCLIGTGQLERGWKLYEVRNHPRFRTATLFAARAPRWQGEDIAGKTLLVLGEQGLGDEIMFASLVPDMLERTGPQGRVLLACERRLVPLFSRSFPAAICGPHAGRSHNAKVLRGAPWAAGKLEPDVVTPAASPLQWLRPHVESFGIGRAYLKPDPARVAHWRERLAALPGEGAVAGLCWRSMLITTQRAKYYSPLEAWAQAFGGTGLRIVNLQYGDCARDIAEARERYGLTIHAFDDIDLKNNLDDAAALSVACDLVVTAPTAAGALAAATGAETWFVLAGRGWVEMGLDHYPWYANTRAFKPQAFGDWRNVMAHLNRALKERSTARAVA
ncbi:MAG: tetratricopeptide repeat protein [Alphaproteobacteria bacterium]|nr:tetratricopeptide repeat protein [Alphaproteobacteria bacterium]